MNEHATPSILQRVPVILAVTAASYGLPVQPQGQPSDGETGAPVARTAPSFPVERSVRDAAATRH